MTTKRLPGSTRFCLVFLVGDGSDCATVFERAFRDADLDVEIVRLPHFLMSELTWKRLHTLKKLLKDKSRTRFVIFSPATTELFLRADHHLIFSAYRSWYSEDKMTVIPHLWTPIPLPQRVDCLKWDEKPPLQIGFMGRPHSSSRLASGFARFPGWAKKWFLSGAYLKYPEVLALMNELGFPLTYINTFARIETLNVLDAKKSLHKEAQLDIVERRSFTGSKSEIKEYANHLQKNTYIICPRGSENYSFRIYETLNCGRIPVIIDTDIVLPKEIDWDRLSIIVPYTKINQIYDLILEDYERRSACDFMERQKIAFSTMASLNSMEWVRDFVSRISERGDQ